MKLFSIVLRHIILFWRKIKYICEIPLGFILVHILVKSELQLRLYYFTTSPLLSLFYPLHQILYLLLNSIIPTHQQSWHNEASTR